MKRCPYCGEENLATAATCYFCGRDLPLQQQDDDVEPTQPRHVQGRGGPRQPNQGPTQPYTPPPGDTQPGGYGAQPAQSYPTPPTHTGYTQPLPPQGAYQQPGQYQQPYQQQGQYPQQPYQQIPPGYYPQQQQPPQYPPNYYPPQQPPAPPERSRLMGMLPVFLGLILLCVCLVAAWVIADTANRGVARLGDQIATRAAGVFAGAPRATDVPITPLPEEPSPWPTFTPEIANEPEPTTSGYAEKLLSPECRSTLDSLSRMSTQLSEEPLKVLDEAWREGLNQARLNLNFYCGSLDSASPVPGQVESAHNALNEASTEFDTANQLLQEAVDGRSPAKILEAAQHFGQAARSLNTALAEIRKVVQ